MNEDNRTIQLNKKAEEAAQIRIMCDTAGFKLLRAKFEEKISKVTNLIVDMNTPDDKVKELRQKIHVWTEITSMLKSLMLTGDYASKIMRDIENLDPQTTPAIIADKEN